MSQLFEKLHAQCFTKKGPKKKVIFKGIPENLVFDLENEFERSFYFVADARKGRKRWTLEVRLVK